MRLDDDIFEEVSVIFRTNSPKKFQWSDNGVAYFTAHAQKRQFTSLLLQYRYFDNCCGFGARRVHRAASQYPSMHGMPHSTPCSRKTRGVH